jgi:uncharacterized repeat protein (TIGR01451 family)
MTKISKFKTEGTMKNFNDNSSLELHGRALLRKSARDIRRTETTKFRRITAGSMAIAVVAMQVMPAFAAITNTVTATGKGPGNSVVTGGANASVGVAPAAPTIKVVETMVLADTNGNNKADPGEIITYFYKVTNSGNVTLKSVTPTQTNDGLGSTPVMVVPTTYVDNGSSTAGTLNDSSDTNTADKKWDVLGPGDIITFTSNYTVLTSDITALGSGTGTGKSGFPEADGFLDDKISVTGTYFNTANGNAPTVATGTDSANTQLNIINTLSVTKVPNVSTNVTAGTPVIYTYTVTNTGNTPITDIGLVDTHNASGTAPTPVFQSFTTNLGGSTYDSTNKVITKLAPGDVAKYTATYIVTQSDIDNLQ